MLSEDLFAGVFLLSRELSVHIVDVVARFFFPQKLSVNRRACVTVCGYHTVTPLHSPTHRHRNLRESRKMCVREASDSVEASQVGARLCVRRALPFCLSRKRSKREAKKSSLSLSK